MKIFVFPRDHLPSPEDFKRKILVKMENKGEKVSKKLSNFVNYLNAIAFPGFQEGGNYYEMSSISETKAGKLIEEDSKAFVKYNCRQLSRIYPFALRTDSSNIDIIPFFNAGCQMGKTTFLIFTPKKSAILKEAALFATKAKINVFFNFSEWISP